MIPGPNYFKLDAATWDAGTDEVRRNYASLSGLPFPAECDDHDLPDDAPASASVAAWGAFLCALWFAVAESPVCRAVVCRAVVGFVLLPLALLGALGAMCSRDVLFLPLAGAAIAMCVWLPRGGKGSE